MHRSTIQRVLVFDTVMRMHGHATADQIHAQISERHPHLSRATVYRNLNNLAQEHKILRISVPGSADFYEANTTPHYHLKCIHCQRIFDVTLPFMDNIEQRINDTHGFKVLGHSLTFYGVCPACQQPKALEQLEQQIKEPPKKRASKQTAKPKHKRSAAAAKQHHTDAEVADKASVQEQPSAEVTTTEVAVIPAAKPKTKAKAKTEAKTKTKAQAEAKAAEAPATATKRKRTATRTRKKEQASE